jgi:hypothetical protein
MAESSRRNAGVTSLLRRNQAKSLIVWSFRVLIVILVVIFVLFKRSKQTPSDTEHMTMPTSYELVETGTTTDGLDFRRYRAMEKNLLTPLSVQQWTDTLASNEEASDSFTKVLQEAPYQAFFLETKGVSSKNAKKKDFEFVLVNAPRLAAFCESHPDPDSFQQHFNACEGSACAFENLGRDARLVSPLPPRNDSLHLASFSHLAIFVRKAPISRVRHFWKLVAETYHQQYNDNNNSSVWLSTEGSGVAWLHVRLDSRPKYYHYLKFAKET